MQTTDDEALVTLSEEIAAAIQRRDVDAVRKHLALEFRHLTPGGPAVDTAGFLEALKGIPGEILLVHVHDLQTDVAGDSAIVCGIQHAKVKIDGDVVEEHRAFADYFLRIDGTWKLRTAIDLPTVA